MPFPNKATQFKQGESRVTDIEIKRKGGRTKSFKRKYAQKLKYLKQKAQLSGADLTWFELTMLNPEASGIDLGGDLELLKDKMSAKDYIKLKQDNHKLRFGEFQRTENVHHIVDWSKMLGGDDVSEEAKEFKGKDTIDV